MQSHQTRESLSLPHDRPIERAEDDRLDRSSFVENLARVLIRDETVEQGRLTARRSTGVIVGLTGRWGSGKTSVLKLLSEHLGKMDNVVVTTFNPWLVNDRDEILAAFFNQLRVDLGKSSSEQVRNLISAVKQYQETVSIAANAGGLLADMMGASGWGSVVAAQVTKISGGRINLKPSSALEERKRLETKMRATNVALVVLIDELDRVDDENVRVVAQLVKAVGDIEGVSYLVAYDPDRVAEALGRGDTRDDRLRSGNAYLEKIIQYPIPIRPLSIHDVSTLLTQLLKQHGLELTNSPSADDEEIVKLIQNSIKTPRDLKRLVGCYAVIDRMVRSEIRAADLLGYCWLLTKAPSIRDEIADRPDSVVDDPEVNELSSRAMKQLSGADVPPSSVAGGFGVFRHCNGLDGQLLCVLGGRQPAQ